MTGSCVPDFPPEKIISILSSAKYLNQFDEAQLTQLLAFSSVEVFEPGTRIIEEKQENKNIYILLQGRVDVFVGSERILNLRRKGDMIGEMSVITRSLTAASVVAGSRVVLFAIPSQEIYRSGRIDLQAQWFKLFSDILVEKLSMTNEKVIGFHETSQDLDHKKKELVHKTMILQSIMGSMTDGVVVFDGSGRVLQVNNAFVRMTGSVAIPEHIEDWPEKIGIFGPDQKTILRVEALPLSRGGDGLSVDTHELFIQNDSRPAGIWLQVTGSPLKSDDGTSLDGCVAVFRDFTSKKQEEEALIRAKEDAEAAARAKSDFLAVMSHELRTPLNGILGMAGLLKNTHLSDEQKAWLEDIEKSGRSLLGKIRDILYYNSLESGDIQIHTEELSLAGLIAAVLEPYRQRAREKGLTFDTHVCSAAAGPLSGDKQKIATVLEHLTANAVKYTQKGGVTIRVTVVEENAASVKFGIEITDTGIGLDQKKLAALFLPFSQSDAGLSRKFEGTGLGLTIAARLVELMGGTLSVKSRPGKGASFDFPLILARIQKGTGMDAAPDDRLEALINERYARRNPLAILVAEDNRVNQLLIKKVLRNLGYAARVAENGLKAVQACREEAFDLVLMDIQMPEMDGLAAAEKILKDADVKRRPKIVALTANTADNIREKCLNSGMVDYMSKPLDIRTLVSVFEKLRSNV